MIIQVIGDYFYEPLQDWNWGLQTAYPHFLSCKLHKIDSHRDLLQTGTVARLNSFCNCHNCWWNLFPREGFWERHLLWIFSFWQTYLMGNLFLTLVLDRYVWYVLCFSETTIQWFCTSSVTQREEDNCCVLIMGIFWVRIPESTLDHVTHPHKWSDKVSMHTKM